MKLLTNKMRRQLLENAVFEKRGGDPLDLKPVVRLYMPDAAGVWLLASLHGNEIAFALYEADSISFPKTGYVSLEEIYALRGRSGLSVQRDLYFRAEKTLRGYVEEARELGAIL